MTPLERQGVALARLIDSCVDWDEYGRGFIGWEDIDRVTEHARKILEEAARVALPHEVQG